MALADPRFHRTSHDREGNNQTLTGFVEYRAKCWWFKIESGNWNGTVVHEWEPASLMPGRPTPAQSVWLFASIEAVMVKVIVGGELPALIRMAREMLLKKEEL